MQRERFELTVEFPQTRIPRMFLKPPASLYQNTWFDTVKSSRIRPRVFYHLQPSSKQAFDNIGIAQHRRPLGSHSSKHRPRAFQMPNVRLWNGRLV